MLVQVLSSFFKLQVVFSLRSFAKHLVYIYGIFKYRVDLPEVRVFGVSRGTLDFLALFIFLLSPIAAQRPTVAAEL